ncbi:aminoacyl-tRNA hydrolase [Blattabacterium cuenoti]|uniref:aminoacyl-tRNA hydrolase n=1 Tax=Blattabacterium cuenoti TaxID=1653831 RepID=UPI00163CCADC|nr:aminoacyl-tRNA hydrolase [Blattabacterium cuenoti]
MALCIHKNDIKYLIIGLGNPGIIYNYTRHNIGFFILDKISEKYSFTFIKKKLGFVSSILSYKNKKIFFLKPYTYINESGLAVKYWMKKEKVSLNNILIILDDIYLDFGTFRLKGKGGNGGHNGLKSIEKELKTDHYARLRFGIKNDLFITNKIDYVLGNWYQHELKYILKKIDISMDIIFSFVVNGLIYTMNIFNHKCKLKN